MSDSYEMTPQWLFRACTKKLRNKKASLLIDNMQTSIITECILSYFLEIVLSHLQQCSQ